MTKKTIDALKNALYALVESGDNDTLYVTIYEALDAELGDDWAHKP